MKKRTYIMLIVILLYILGGVSANKGEIVVGKDCYDLSKDSTQIVKDFSKLNDIIQELNGEGEKTPPQDSTDEKNTNTT